MAEEFGICGLAKSYTFYPCSLSVYVALFRRKERLCNSCFVELQHELTTTTDTETDSELSTSPERGNSPVSENTVVEGADTVSADNDNVLLASSGDTAVSNADEDEEMSHSASAASNNAGWSMRGSAYSAMTWVSGVVSRSFVRPGGEQLTEGQPPTDGDTEVDAAVSDADHTAVTLDIGSEETVSAVTDVQSEDANSTLTDTFSADANVAECDDVSNCLSAHQSVAALSDSVNTVSTSVHTTDNVTQPSLSCDSTASGPSESPQSGDTVQRYLLYLWIFCFSCSIVM